MLVRGTTPTIRFFFKTIKVEELVECYLTLAQNGSTIIEKNLEAGTVVPASDTERGYIEWTLDQTDTLLIDADGKVDIQIRYKDDNGNVAASQIYTSGGYRILKDGAI